MKRLAISLALLAVLASSGCWRPYYGRRFGQHPYAQPAYGQPQFAPAAGQPTYGAPVVQQGAPVVQQGAPVVTEVPAMQAAPVQTYAQPAPAYQTYQPYSGYQQQCVPCQPTYCVPCY